jgi:6-phosphofructokinase 1
MNTSLNFDIERLGPSEIASPISGIHFVDEVESVLYPSTSGQLEDYLAAGEGPPCFEAAGPRRAIHFDPLGLRCGIVTCGGLCPGLNDVIRAIVLSLHFHYGVQKVYGFRYGYQGLSSPYRETAWELTPDLVDGINHKGGTILGSSRGPQDVGDMVDTLEQLQIKILFTVGGDGTLRGAQALAGEIGRRLLDIAVIGIPKTIDNDISFVQQSFGFETAVTESRTAVYSANMEALGARNGMGLVKLMGRDSGFIAAYATLACSEVNYCLVPEVPFSLSAFLEHLEQRLHRRGHAVIVAAEGAGQDLIQKPRAQDQSGNVKHEDIGLFLKEAIQNHFQDKATEISLKYIDPSYTIRSMPANPHDSVFCLLLGHNAVHAGMAGRTNMVVGYWSHRFTHVPIALAVSQRQKIDPGGRLWSNVLGSTGQPASMV